MKKMSVWVAVLLICASLGANPEELNEPFPDDGGSVTASITLTEP